MDEKTSQVGKRLGRFYISIFDEMGKTENKRLHIFQKFERNLNVVRNTPGIGFKTRDIVGDYICPICVNGFFREDLNQKVKNPLTLEDVPPKSLGGKQIALTCQNCNNGLGIDIDWHLTERLKELEFKDKIPLSERHGTFELDGIHVKGKLKYDIHGKLLNEYSRKNNNPLLLESFLEKMKNGVSVKFSPNQSRVDVKKIQIALLKNAYLLMFERFGYSIIFNEQYDRIRSQLTNPHEDIYPLNCWFQAPFPKEHLGVSFVTEEGIESIFVMFEIKTRRTERTFSVILPLISNRIENVIQNILSRFENEESFAVQMEKYTDDYLTETNSMLKLVNWMKQIDH